MSEDNQTTDLAAKLNRDLVISTPFKLEASLAPNHRHTFGGDLEQRICNIDSCIKLHKLLEFDLEDNRLGMFEACNAKRLPLLYPMQYENSRLNYSFTDEYIIIHHFESDSKFNNPSKNEWPYRDYPQELPSISLNLGEISYSDHKSYIFNSLYTSNFLDFHLLSEEDQNLISTNRYPFPQLGGMHFIPSGAVPVSCNNPVCPIIQFSQIYPQGQWENQNNMVLVATISGDNFCSDISLWGEYGDAAQIQFFMCENCLSISASSCYIDYYRR